MSTRKKIDKLYLSKFEGAEIAPPEDAWQNIAARLPEAKKNKRLVPIWFRYAGTAAILLLLVSLSKDQFSTDKKIRIVSNPVTRQDIHKEIRLSSANFTEVMLEVSMSLQDMMQREATSAVILSKKNNGFDLAAKSTVALSSASDERPEELAASESLTEDSGFTLKSGSVLAGSSGQVEALENKNENSKFANKEDLQTTDQNSFANEEIQEENALAQMAIKFSGSEEETGEAAEGRISISTRVAPVFYDNRGSGNVAASGMAGSEASGEVSFSYGLNLAYQVSDKIRIRSGINKLDLSFSTPSVPMAAFTDTQSFVGNEDPNLMSKLVTGDLRQQMNFIEVPLEVEYRLLDSRIDLNLIAGGSTLFLNNNHLSMDTGIRTTDLGKAENMEELNFSANMGLGLDYELAPSFHLNLEPMFKYQLNSLGEGSGMRPYYLAIYSGFSISF